MWLSFGACAVGPHYRNMWLDVGVCLSDVSVELRLMLYMLLACRGLSFNLVCLCFCQFGVVQVCHFKLLSLCFGAVEAWLWSSYIHAVVQVWRIALELTFFLTKFCLWARGLVWWYCRGFFQVTLRTCMTLRTCRTFLQLFVLYL